MYEKLIKMLTGNTVGVFCHNFVSAQIRDRIRVTWALNYYSERCPTTEDKTNWLLSTLSGPIFVRVVHLLSVWLLSSQNEQPLVRFDSTKWPAAVTRTRWSGSAFSSSNQTFFLALMWHIIHTCSTWQIHGCWFNLKFFRQIYLIIIFDCCETDTRNDFQ